MGQLPPFKKRRIDDENGDDSYLVEEDNAEENDIRDSAFAKGASRWNLEQNYEKKPRHSQKEKLNLRLPIKTFAGVVEQSHVEPVDLNLDASESNSEQGEEPEVDTEVSTTIAAVPPRVQIAEAKEELARTAALINENPEEHIEALKRLADFNSSPNLVVVKLALAAQAAVFKDVIPGYQIRPMQDGEASSKLSKDVRRLRNFEQTLVHRYHLYVKELAKLGNPKKSSSSPLSTQLISVAVSCACSLLKAVPHFNFRGELLRIIMGRLGQGQIDEDFVLCQDTLQELFENDDTGNATLEATSQLSKMIKAKYYRVDERVLNLFLHLRLLTEFSHRASNRTVDKTDDGSVGTTKGLKKSKREYRSKKERKLAKANKAIEKEMREADAVVSHEDRDQMQSETLKLVFGVYFRILKDRVPHLMSPVLEGLVKYAHLINQDFFGDILESLKELLSETLDNNDHDIMPGTESSVNEQISSSPRDVTRESLLCIITAFALLQGQDATKAATSLHLDLSFFISHLYNLFYATCMHPDVELSTKSLQLPDPDDRLASTPLQNKVDVQTTMVLLVRSLQAVMLPENARSVPPIRLAAFTKQLMTISLQLPEKSSMATIGLLNQVIKTHHQKLARLWNTEERQGDGVFQPLRADLESSAPLASTVWEGELLKLHFSPKVKAGVKSLESHTSANKT